MGPWAQAGWLSALSALSPGHAWLSRVTAQWPNAVWLNPVREKHWGYTHSISMISELFSQRMYPLTLTGLEQATRELSRRH